jgi:hypothetical protein
MSFLARTSREMVNACSYLSATLIDFLKAGTSKCAEPLLSTFESLLIRPSALFIRRILGWRIDAESHGWLVATVREPVFYPWWNNHHVARLHARPPSADLSGELPVNQKQHLVAAGMGLGFVAAALSRAECHHRGLASLRGLQNFEPLFRSVKVGAFRGHFYEE